MKIREFEEFESRRRVLKWGEKSQQMGNVTGITSDGLWEGRQTLKNRWTEEKNQLYKKNNKGNDY